MICGDNAGSIGDFLEDFVETSFFSSNVRACGVGGFSQGLAVTRLAYVQLYLQELKLTRILGSRV